MSTFIDIARPLAERGFRVFPLISATKAPVKLSWGDHFDHATTDVGDLEAWDKEVPSSNVGISPCEHFMFLETDDEAALKEACKDLTPEIWDTARVTSGRPNRCYYVFRHTKRTREASIRDKACTRTDADGKRIDNLFEFKSFRTYVTGPGSIHPETKGTYTADWRVVRPMPDILLNRLCELMGEAKATAPKEMSAEVREHTGKLERFLEYYEVPALGPWFNKGKSWYLPIECPWSANHENTNQGTSTCVVFTEGGGYGFNCKHRCAGKTWHDFRAEVEGRFPERTFSFVQAEQTATIDEQPKPVSDWRARYHSFAEMDNAPPAEFLIEGFLQLDAITAIAAPVGQRKSLIALNVAHALCTGERLFDYFEVSKQPTRVLYLCPEMGLRSFTDRLRRIGLMPHVGKKLFCRTMSAEGTLELRELTSEELGGAAVVIDTAVRYLKGDENSSEHMRRFAEDVFRLMRDGAVSELLLHHSAKGTKETSELSLENAMRGSGELGAFVSSCWATRLQKPDDPYQSASYLTNVKQRDFESKPFEVTSGKDCRLHIVDKPGEHVKLNSKPVGAPANPDGKEEEALRVIRENPALSIRGVTAKLRELGIKRSKSWVGDKRYEVLNVGVKTSA